MVNPMTWCPSARSMAATVEESTPPDIATAMVLESGIVRSLSPFHLNALWTDSQYLLARREEQPVVITCVGVVQIVSRRNCQPEISENKRSLEMFWVKANFCDGHFHEPSDCYGNDMTIRIRIR